MPVINTAGGYDLAAYQGLSSVNRSQAADQSTRAQYGQNAALRAQADTASFSSQALDALAASRSTASTTTVNGLTRSESADTQSATVGQTRPEIAARIRQYQVNQAVGDERSAGTAPSAASRSQIDNLTGISASDRPSQT